MKNLNFYFKNKPLRFMRFGLFIFVSLLFFSCQSYDEECYSCDKSVDLWAKQNMTAIQKMDRQTIITLSGEKQRAAFRVMRPIKRQELWLNKLNYLQEFMKTDVEKKFVFEIIEIAENWDFSKEMNEDELDSMDSKLLEAAQRFNWTQDFVVYAFGTLHNIEIDKNSSSDFFGQSNNQDSANARPGTGEVHIGFEDADCNCRLGWCGDGGSCVKSACSDTDLGCGALWLGSCTKICSAVDG